MKKTAASEINGTFIFYFQNIKVQISLMYYRGIKIIFMFEPLS